MSIVLQGSTSGSITLQEPAIAGNTVLSLPARTSTIIGDDGAGKVRKADMPTGSVLQVVSTTKTDTFSMSGSSFTDITGLSVSITPLSATSKILVMVSVGLAGAPSNVAYTIAFRLMRDSTAIGVGDAAGSRTQSSFRVFTQADSNHGRNASFSHLDSPASTSSLTYKLQMVVQDGVSGFINRTGNDSDGGNAYQARSASSITVMEVAA